MRDAWSPTPEQQAAWQQWRNAPAPHAHVVRIALACQPEPAAVDAALAALRERHDVLCMACIGDGSQLVACVPQSGSGVATIVVTDGAAPALPALEPAQGDVLRACLCPLATGGATLWLLVSPLAVDRDSVLRLAEAVRAAVETPAADDAGPPLQYAQYADWQEGARLGEDGTGNAGRGYWQAHAAGLPAPLRLPDALAGSAATPADSWRHTLHAAHRLALDATARQFGTTPERVLQAAWWTLLARLCAQPAFSATWLHDCRRDYDVMAGAAGVFVKALPLGVQWDDEASLRHHWQAWLPALDGHAAWQEAWPPGDAGPRIGFAVSLLPAGGIALASPAWPGIDLVCEALDDGQGMAALALHAQAGALHPRVGPWLLSHLAALIGTLPAALDAPLPSLWWPDDDTLRVPPCWSGEKPAAADDPLLNRIARHARGTPTAPALDAADLVLDYVGLQRTVHAAAQRLRALGVGPGTRVALALPRSGALVASLLAVWAAGGAYVPLDPAWPQARRRSVLAQAAPVLTIAQQASPDDGAIIGADALLAAATAPEDSAPEDTAPAKPYAAAYVLFTSGSTGEPKGVVIGHAQISHYTAAACDALSLSSCQRFGLTSSVAADLGNTTLFAALWQGGCLVVASDDDMAHPAAFARYLRGRAVDAIKIVPSHLAALLETEAPAVPSTIILGGEPLPASLVGTLRRHAPGCRIFNHYGPTETTIGVMVHALGAEVPAWPAGTAPLSRALGATRVRLLDDALRPVPAGVAGQLYVGGPQLALGYLGRADLDAAAFVDDPFVAGERLYRTGDLARATPAGLQLLGRADQQVKIRGIRVEPAEIEAALLAQPAVAQAAVCAVAGPGGEAVLCAFLVPAAAGAIDAPALRHTLAAMLPDAMVPARFVALAALPRLPNGKTDRVALRELVRADSAPAPAAAPAAAPASDAVEALVCALMAELLERGQVDPHADFFALGGHSLLVIKLVARLRRRLQVEIAPGMVFDHPSAHALAAAVRREASDRDLDTLAHTALAAAAPPAPAALPATMVA
ncbi:amino acid adenylation domain-containing protein [Cupriavidus consociatus]|uniref:non-ribosomal peptide synthetase n=1 Tax=Cupriavidus consociatus TaxID=2821357 RepID=UPI001FD7A84A|nr:MULTISPECIES: amino acid adenylation domain-containing protein [unclassified Cupriavidus]MDK2655636.1 amino acid adenylation domain-containing protein [Cupriavidus sp. LEh21]